MERKLIVKGRTGRFDVPSFILSENDDLQISVEIENEIRVGRYRLVVKHGTGKKMFVLSSGKEIELHSEWLKQSAENVEFSLVLLNATETAVIKDDYQIEPLKIETVGGNFVFSSVLQEIITRQEEQEKRLAEMQEKLQQFEESGVPLIAENNE